MKRILILVLSLMIAILNSAQVGQSQVKIVAKNIFNERIITNRNQVTENELESISLYEDNIFLVKSALVDGFVLISGSTDIYPVLAYSSLKTFEINNIPPALTDLLDKYNEQILAITERNIKATSEITRSWNSFTSNEYTSKRDRDSAGPLITSLWNQCKYYNVFCPEDEEGIDGHVPVGCVATAMAQIMHYYQYPSQGSGSHSYYADGYGIQSVLFDLSSYDWDNIPDYLTDYNTDLARLGYDCGVSVEMMYGPHGSGAYSNDVPYALKTYFNYDTSCDYESRDNYSESNWTQLLKNEIDNSRPMHYSGSSDLGGHAFVCDGYDDNFFHFNWGWDGLFNGYYLLDNLNPRFSDFSWGQAAIIGIKPASSPIVDFEASHTVVRTCSAVNFTDLSRVKPTSWMWSFENATPSSSEEQNPQNIVFPNAGTYSVTLMAANDFGFNTETKTDYILVSDDIAPVASFTFTDSLIDISETISLINTSYNLPDSYSWNITPNSYSYENATNQNSQDPQISFSNPGVYDISLTVNNSSGSSEITQVLFVDGFSIPYYQDFELPLSETRWSVENPDSGYSWDGCYFAGGMESGAKCVYVKCSAYNTVGERDGLISPPINLTGYNEINLTFKHAYSSVSSYHDSLIVYINVENNDDWHRIFAVSETGTYNFSTVDETISAFIPQTIDQWSGNGVGAEDINIALDEWSAYSNAKFKFEVYNDNGNNFFLDDISITGNQTANVDEDIAPANISIKKSYPNPFSNMAQNTLSFSVKRSSFVSIGIYNIKGQKVKSISSKQFSKGQHTVKWDGTDKNGKSCSSGIYFYKLSSKEKSFTSKMALIK